MWEKLMGDQRQSEPASPNPLEIVMMGLLKTTGKNADFIVVFTAEVLYLGGK